MNLERMAKTTTKQPDYIDPVTLMRIKSLQLRAKSVVEGFQNGLNRSPFHGFSVEFSEYREYTPGDDPRFLDWKLYGRSDRHYIKKFEDETNLRCHLLLDLSRSMGYGSGEYPKIEYTRTLAATFGYFLSTQRDAVGLMTFDQHVADYIPARFRIGHMRRMMQMLAKQVAGNGTNVSAPLLQAAEQLNKRGMVVLMSDLLCPLDTLQENLGFLRARKHEVIVFQVLDPAEVNFDFDQPALFEDVESGREIYVDPNSARETYLERFQQHQQSISDICDRLGVTYRCFTSDQPLELALGEFLRTRMQAKGQPTRQKQNTTEAVS